MNRPLKAALLSAFVFPGVGHFVLKKYLHGTVLAGTALAGLYFLITRTVEIAFQIAEQIQSGEVQADAVVIAELVSKQTSGSEAPLLNIATALIFLAWLIGIVDSYRVGRNQNKIQDKSGDPDAAG
ncbi:MAG: hypothetical protein ACC642_02410 [Pseudomonadales bacterium]